MALKTELLDLGKGRRWAEGDNYAKQQDAMYAHALVAALKEVSVSPAYYYVHRDYVERLTIKADELMAEWLGDKS